MASRKTAILMVSADWATRRGVRSFLGWSKDDVSRPNMITAPLDRMDERGVWLTDITSPVVKRKDGKPVVLHLMIPWHAIEVFALASESEKQLIGFKLDEDPVNG